MYLLPPSTPDEAALRDMERACIHGSLGGLVDALLLCRRKGRPPPAWCAQEAAMIAVGAHDDPTRKRHASAHTRHRENIIHRLRWDAAVYVQDLRRVWREEERSVPDQLRAAGAPEDEIMTSMRAGRIARFPELVRPKNAEGRDDFRVAASLLELTPAGGSAETVRRSYRLVENERLTRGDLYEFYLPSDDALNMLGFCDLAGVCAGLLATTEAKRARVRT